MQTLQAVKNRKCVREFLDKPINKETLEKLFDAVRWTPSSKNTQPWKIAIVSGKKKKELMNKILSACDNREPPRMEYGYDGNSPLEGELKERAVKCGHDLYNALGIAREDKERRIEQWKKTIYHLIHLQLYLYLNIPIQGLVAIWTAECLSNQYY